MASPTSSISDISEINESFIGDVEEDNNYNVREQCGHQQQMANGSTINIKGTAAYQDEVGECQNNQSLAYDSLYSAQDRGILRPQTPPLPDNLKCLPDVAGLSINGGGKQSESDLSLAIERQRLELDRFKEAHLQKRRSTHHQQQATMSTSHQQDMPTHSFTNIPSNICEVSCPKQASSNVSNITSKSEALSKAYEKQREEYERIQKEHMKRNHQQNSNQHEMVHSAALNHQIQQQQQSINHQEVTGSANGSRTSRSIAAGSMSSSLMQNDRGGRQSPQPPPPNHTSKHDHLESLDDDTYPTRQGDRSGEMIPPTAEDEEELSEELFNHYLDVFNQTKFNPAPGFYN